MHAAIVMLSNFGRADGGRETWAYNFIPRLLDRYPKLSLDVYGLRIAGEADNREEVLASVTAKAEKRLGVAFVEASADRLPKALAFWRKLPRLAAANRAPSLVVAVGSWVDLLAALRVPKFRASAKVVWLRTIFADEKAHRYPRFLRPVIERVELAVLRRADRVIANGEDTAAYYRARGLDVTVIPNAVDLQRWEMPPPKLAAPIVAAYIGRLAQVKGIEEFVEAARRSASGVRYVVAGDGPARELVDRAAAAGALEFKGPIDNEHMPGLLASTDVCLGLTFAGRRDRRGSAGGGVSNALLEQMAAGRILVCWDNPAYRQVISAESGYLVPQGDVAALSETLSCISNNPRPARERAARAAEVARSYGFDTHLARFAAAVEPWLGQAGLSSTPRRQ